MPSNFREMAGTSAQTSLKKVPHAAVATGSWSRCQIPSPALEIWLETGLADSQWRQLMTDRLSGQEPCTVPISQKRKGDSDVSWGNPSAATASDTAVHKSVGLNCAGLWDLILNQVNTHLCYLLSQAPQHQCCSGKEPTARSVCPLPSSSPLSLSLQHPSRSS